MTETCPDPKELDSCQSQEAPHLTASLSVWNVCTAPSPYRSPVPLTQLDAPPCGMIPFSMIDGTCSVRVTW